MTFQEFYEIYSQIITELEHDNELTVIKKPGKYNFASVSAEITAIHGWRDGHLQKPMLAIALFALLQDKEIVLHFDKILELLKNYASQPTIEYNYYPMAIRALEKIRDRFFDTHYGEPLNQTPELSS